MFPTVGIGAKEIPNKSKYAYLEKLIELRGAQHVAGGAREVAGTMADSDCSDYSAFTSSELQNKLAMVLCLRFEDGEWGTCECPTPVGELGIGRSIWDGDWLEETIELHERNDGKLSRRRHCRNELRGDEPC